MFCILEATGATTWEIGKRISEGRIVIGMLNCLVEKNYPSQNRKTYVPSFSQNDSTMWGRNIDTKHTTGEQITGNWDGFLEKIR
jgi:hypothetical protein